jgi:hypothetical protein
MKPNKQQLAIAKKIQTGLTQLAQGEEAFLRHLAKRGVIPVS